MCRKAFLGSLGLVDLPVLVTSVTGSVVDDSDGRHDLAVVLLSVVVLVQASKEMSCVCVGRGVMDEELLDGVATSLSVDHVDVM